MTGRAKKRSPRPDVNVRYSLKPVLLRNKLAVTSTKTTNPTIADRDSGTTSIPESSSGVPLLSGVKTNPSIDERVQTRFNRRLFYFNSIK